MSHTWQIEHTRPEQLKKVMIHAQLDIAAAIEYAVGLRDTFEVEGPQKTLEELGLLTEDPAGRHLMFRELDHG
jgi:hypothetical protein